MLSLSSTSSIEVSKIVQNPKMPGASLKIGVVGAGVAGLSAAIALRKIGHDVEVSTMIGCVSSID